MFGLLRIVPYRILSKIRRLFLGLQLFMFVLLCCCSGLKAQEIAWLRADETTNSSATPNYSEVRSMTRDNAGNVYTSIQFFGSISIGEPGNQVLVESTMGAATVVVKHDANGNMLWHRLYPFLSNNRMVMDVSPNGTLMLVAEVRGDFDIIFDGERLNPDPLVDYMFYIWLDEDGEIINWKFRDEIFEDFKLENLSDVLVFDDLTFWLSGGYAKEQLGDSFTRHDIEFISYFDAEAEPIQRNHFDAGERGEEEIDYILFDDFQQVNGEIYIPAHGNGFYGYSDGDRSEGKVHAFILKINSSNTISLVLATPDATDNMFSILMHKDGGISMVIKSSDGVFNTTMGDFPVGVKTQSTLIHIRDEALISVMDLPESGSRLSSLTDRDDLIGITGFAHAASSYVDGYGNALKVPNPGPSLLAWVAIYNTAGQIEYTDFFEGQDQDRLSIRGGAFDNLCDGFLIGGYTLGAIDLNLGHGPAETTPDYARSRYFMVKYQNGSPELTLEEEYVFCPDTEKTFEMMINDEALSTLQVSVSAPNADFDPSLVSINGAGVLRTFDLTGVQSGDYTLRVRVEDECGAVEEKDVLIREIPVPAAPIISQNGEYMLCPGDTLKLTATSDLPLLWSEGSTSDTLKIYEAGDFWVKALTGTNCNSSNSDTVNVVMAVAPEMPEIAVEGSLILCPGDEVTLTASLNDRLLWSTGESSQSITVNQPGLYSVYQTSDNCGNSETSMVEVRFADVPPPPTIEVIGGTQVCEGDEVLLRSSAGANSRWSTGETGSEILITASGAYWVRGFDGDCDGLASEPLEVEVFERFAVDLVRDTTICDFFEPLELVPVVSQPDLDFLWSDGSSSSSLIVNEPGEYWVEVSNGACTEVLQVSVEELCLPTVYMPNAFSPNGDGDNDHFAPVGQRVVDFQMIIYNQWGKLVFVSLDINQGWDGTIDGQKAPAGKYVYTVSYNGLIRGELLSYSQNGKLDLIR